MRLMSSEFCAGTAKLHLTMRICAWALDGMGLRSSVGTGEIDGRKREVELKFKDHRQCI